MNDLYFAGKTPGIVQPSSEAQASLIRQTYADAGLEYSDTQYVEAHGTGTQLGDPLEMRALAESMQTVSRQPHQSLYVGSVKTSVGHLEGGAGLAGLLKTILSLENGVILPNTNFKKPNPKLLLDQWHMKVATMPIDWPSTSVRRASVNSFGYGGSNAHCVVDNAADYLKQHALGGQTAESSKLCNMGNNSGLGHGQGPDTSGNPHVSTSLDASFFVDQKSWRKPGSIYSIRKPCACCPSWKDVCLSADSLSFIVRCTEKSKTEQNISAIIA